MTTFDLIVRSGSVVDGLGSSMVRADVGVLGDRVSAIGDLHGERAGVEIDATDRIVTPGFVDIHTHLDAQLGMGSDRDLVVLARRDDGRDGQLRRDVRARAVRTIASTSR